MSGTQEHLEHAEHTTHAAHGGGFAARVAFTMALIAAILAVVTMLSHRSHNATLVFHVDSNRRSTEANVLQTKASDTWSEYQAKKNRCVEYKAFARLAAIGAKDPGGAKALEDATRDWTAQVEKYESGAKGELSDLKASAEALEKEADEKKIEAARLIEQGDLEHHRSDRFDLGELAVEFGLVLSSIAMLAKKRSFWLVAILCTIVGTLVALTGVTGHLMAQEGGAHGAATPGEHR